MKLFYIYNEVIFHLTLKIYNAEEHLVSILSHRHQSMKRNSNQLTFKTLLGSKCCQ